MRNMLYGLPLFLAMAVSAKAATVNCNFMTETTITTSGEWVSSSTDFMKMLDLYGENGLTLKLENSLLVKLDSNQVFLAGETALGKVYLKGSEMGVEGKNIRVTGDQIVIHDGMCDVGFGR